MDWTIALDKDNYTLTNSGTTADSNIIYIPPGKTALLSLYNMTLSAELQNGVLTSNDCATIIKLSFGKTPEITAKMDCTNMVNLTRELNYALTKRKVLSEPVEQCCKSWTLNSCNNYALIPVAGFYRVRLHDVDQLDEVYIEYTLLDVQDTVSIPDAFKLGGSGCCEQTPCIPKPKPDTPSTTKAYTAKINFGIPEMAGSEITLSVHKKNGVQETSEVIVWRDLFEKNSKYAYFSKEGRSWQYETSTNTVTIKDNLASADEKYYVFSFSVEDGSINLQAVSGCTVVATTENQVFKVTFNEA